MGSGSVMGDLGREFEWTADVKCEWTAGKLSGSFWGARGGGGGGEGQLKVGSRRGKLGALWNF